MLTCSHARLVTTKNDWDVLTWHANVPIPTDACCATVSDALQLTPVLEACARVASEPAGETFHRQATVMIMLHTFMLYCANRRAVGTTERFL
jgi:hypothetical protein